MTRKPKTISFWRGRLPHLEVEEGRYFVTIHLAGAIPAAGRARLRKLAAELSQVRRRDPNWMRLQRLIFGEMERWLDHAQWRADLARKEVAGLVCDAIGHRQERGDWNMFEYVVMPTHIHLFFELGRGGLKETLEDFKRWTAHQAIPLVGGDRERFRQREWFDHWSRSDEEDERIIAYIRQNPVKAQLVSDPKDWPYRGCFR
jgi:REP element-mobilizing transposase RayT